MYRLEWTWNLFGDFKSESTSQKQLKMQPDCGGTEISTTIYFNQVISAIFDSNLGHLIWWTVSQHSFSLTHHLLGVVRWQSLQTDAFVRTDSLLTGANGRIIHTLTAQLSTRSNRLIEGFFSHLRSIGALVASSSNGFSQAIIQLESSESMVNILSNSPSNRNNRSVLESSTVQTRLSTR